MIHDELNYFVNSNGCEVKDEYEEEADWVSKKKIIIWNKDINESCEEMWKMGKNEEIVL